MEYFVAETYKNWERIGEPFEQKGKLFTKVKNKCDRCTKGVYVTRVENGQLVPHPAYGGVCLKCGGTGWLEKTVRLYTEKEHQANLRAAERREEERKAKLEEYQAKLAAQADEKKAQWLEDEAFSEDGFTFCYIMPDSYARKNELKNAGFKYNANLGWHRPTADGFEEGVIRISANDVADFSAWGSGTYRASAKQFVKDAAKHMLPVSNSEWIGEEGEKVKDIVVILKSIYEVETRYGYTQLVKFEDIHGNILQWWTSVKINVEIGDQISLTGTIKKLDIYNENKVTIVTRCRIKKI